MLKNEDDFENEDYQKMTYQTEPSKVNLRKESNQHQSYQIMTRPTNGRILVKQR